MKTHRDEISNADRIKDLERENRILNKRLSKVVKAFEEVVEDLAVQKQYRQGIEQTNFRHDWFERAGLLDEDF